MRCIWEGDLGMQEESDLWIYSIQYLVLFLKALRLLVLELGFLQFLMSFDLVIRFPFSPFE